MPRARASFRGGPGGLDDGWVQRRYCTSTVIVWLAATSAWSFVAPVTVIWCVPLLKPLNVPWKPFWYSLSTNTWAWAAWEPFVNSYFSSKLSLTLSPFLGEVIMIFDPSSNWFIRCEDW